MPDPNPLSSDANVHPMQTQSKSGVYRPKSILSLSSHANLHPMQTHWREAMAEEFNALVQNDT